MAGRIGTMYGMGDIKLDDQNRVTRVGGIKHTIKDGILFDAAALRADVRRIVREAKDCEKLQITPPARPDWRRDHR
jgi:hypothetical protein